MWVIKYGRHWVYLKYKEYRFETRHYLVALLVYLFLHLRYSLSVYPVKYLKMYKSEDVVRLSTYSASYQGRKHESVRKMPRKW